MRVYASRFRESELNSPTLQRRSIWLRVTMIVALQCPSGKKKKSIHEMLLPVRRESAPSDRHCGREADDGGSL